MSSGSVDLGGSGCCMADVLSPLPVQTLNPGDVQLSVGSNFVSASNPFPVAAGPQLSGTPVNSYFTQASLAKNASVNANYTVTLGKTFYGKKFWISSAGTITATVQTSPDGTTFTSVWTGVNGGAASPNIDINLGEATVLVTGTGAVVRITITNIGGSASAVYSTISGTEI